MTELFLDEHRIDMEAEQIRQTFQNNILGSVKDRQLSLTNTFKAYNTGKNARFFKHLQELNSLSYRPYRYMKSKIIENGLEINIGTAIVKKSNDEYVEIYIFSGNNSLYESINNKSIRELDWSSENHTISYAEVESTHDESKGYIYALCNQTNLSDKQAYLENWLPSVYEWYLFDKILTEAGYTYSGDIFSDPNFLAKVVNPVTFDEDQSDLLVRDFSKFMPDMLQTEFIRELLVRYGLMFELDRNTTNYSFTTIKAIFRNNTDTDDWSDKFIKVNDVEYTLGDYGRKNYIKYKDRDGYNGSADGFFELDIEHLDQQKTIHSSQYAAYYQLTVFEAIRLPIFIYNDDETEMEIEEIDPSVSELLFESTSIQMTSEAGSPTSFSGDVPKLRFTNLNYSKYTLENYYELKQIANTAKVINAQMFISAADIYNLSFFKLKYIKPLGSFFYLNKISNYVEDKTCSVELVRIPPNVFSETESINTAPVVTLDVSPVYFNIGETTTFQTSVVDAENNVERWELTFGQSGIPKQTGFGVPPTYIPFDGYSVAGDYTATLVVWDFEGLTGFDTTNVQVREPFTTSWNRSMGEYGAPAGSTVTITLDTAGSGSNFMSGAVKPLDSGDPDIAILYKAMFGGFTDVVFVMPPEGFVYIELAWNAAPSPEGAIQTGTITIENNGEVKSSTVTWDSPIPLI
tara:strand:+ start:5887 stop:7950 length:2064 start_codon:yes stop_codon:yes gene_type:complete